MAKKKHTGSHVMYHQTGYRVVVHDLKSGERIKEGPWLVIGSHEPIIFNHDPDNDNDDDSLETAAQEAAEQAATTGTT